MTRRVAMIAAAAALAGMSASEGVASAQTPPVCRADSAAVLSFRDLPAQLIQSRGHRFGFNDPGFTNSAGWVDSDVQVQMIENGQPFFTGTARGFELEDALFYIRSDPGDQPLTVTATYTEYRSYPDPQQGGCTRVISQTMTAVPGRALPRLAVRANDEEAKFALADAADGEDCAQTYAPTPVAVQVRPSGARRWATMISSDQCYGFDRSSVRGTGLRLARESYLPTLVYFQPRTPKRTHTKDYQFRVMSARIDGDGNATVGSTVVRRGVLRVKTTHVKSERVYGTHSDGRINDDYWNYCVNEGKKTWMHNGNPYCVRPGSTRRYVTLRR